MKFLSLFIAFLTIWSNSFGAVFSSKDKSNENKNICNFKGNPQYFIENKGQWNDQVKYLSRLSGLDAWIVDSGIVYDFYRLEKQAASLEQQMLDKFNNEFVYNRIGNVVSMKFLHTIQNNGNVKFSGEEKQKTYFNYFIGNDSNKWKSNVNLYEKLEIQNLYSNISARYYFDNEGLRYDLLLFPGANPNEIRISFQGLKNLKININGELEFETSIGKVKQKKLFAYQIINGKKVETTCSFLKLSTNEIGFSVEWKDKTQALIIDPLLYSTFIGGGLEDQAYAIDVDAFGNSYITGYTLSTNFPTIVGSYDISFNQLKDVFVTKLNNNGSSIVYSTFIGGVMNDIANGIVLDASGNILITGSCSSNYPLTSGVYDETPSGTIDVFVTKLNSTGTSLVYSTLIGNSSVNDCGYAVATDNSGNAYITGTAGSDFPTTTGAYDETFNGGNNDVFVAKLNSTGTSLLFSTLFGGNSSYDYGYGIATDASGNIYATGYTYSSNFPVTTGAFDETQNGYRDVFILKLNSTGNSLIYSTFLGDMYDDYGRGIIIDTDGNAYVTGYTGSSLFPTTSGVFDQYGNGSFDVFVTKLNSTGSSLIFSTLIGGYDDDMSYGIAFDSYMNVIVAGTTYSSSYPVTYNAYDIAENGSRDVFLTKFNSTGSSLVYSSFIGGNGTDIAYGVAVDGSNNAIVTGSSSYSSSFNYPTTPNAYDLSQNYDWDAIVTKVYMPYSYVVYSPVLCYGGNSGSASVQICGGTSPYSYLWNTGESIAALSGITAGYYIVTVTDANNISEVNTIEITQPSSLLTINATTVNNICSGNSTGAINLIMTNGNPPYYTLWSNGSTSSYINNLQSGNYFVTVSDYGGCVLTFNYSITEPQQIAITATINSSIGNIDLSVAGGTSPYLYHWSNNQTTQDLTWVLPGNYSVTVLDFNYCTSSAIFSIPQIPLQIISLQSTNITCYGLSNGSIDLTVDGNNFPINYLWSNGATTQDLQNIFEGLYLVTVTNGIGTIQSASVTISSPTALNILVTATPILCHGDQSIISIMASGGTLPYTGDSTFSAFAGNYLISVSDNNGCVTTSNINITEPQILSIISNSSIIYCSGDSSTIQISGIGGTFPYSGTGSFEFPSGMYSFTITDSNNCIDSTTVIIDESNVFHSDISATPILCFGDNSNITVSASGGITPYSGTGNYIVSNGTYSYIVSDSNGCIDTTETLTITEPTELSINISYTQILCHGGNSIVTVTADGGTLPYSGTGNFNATEGTHQYTVNDANGCTVGDEININSPTAILVTSSITNASSISSNDGAIDITVSGGTQPYSYHWSNNSSDEDISGIIHGNYSVTVTDNNNCKNIKIFTVNYSNQINNSNNAISIEIFPNPFSNQTTININAEKFEIDEISVYNLIGEKIETIESDFVKTGSHSYEFSSQNYSNGTYLLKIISKDFIETKKLIIIK